MGLIGKIKKKFNDVPDYIGQFRSWFGVRILLKRFFQLPVISKTTKGSWLFFGSDVLDEKILKSLNKTHEDIYFPATQKYNQGDVVLDVGGHHGFFALELTSRHPEVRVFSFEPDPTSFRYLRFNRFLNKRKNITLLNYALSNKTGQSNLVISDEGSWGNYVTDSEEQHIHSIKTLSVTDFIQQHQIGDVAYLKLNAEGAEFDVIPGLFRAGVYPRRIALFAHPERGDVDALVKLVMDNEYTIGSSSMDKKRPWFVFLHA